LGDTQDIADLEARSGQRRGQHAVDAALLKLAFAAQHFVTGALPNEVDGHSIANDFEPVDDEIALVGKPGKLERTKLGQRLGIVDPVGDVGKGMDYSVLQSNLLVEQHDRFAFRHRRLEVGWEHPVGHLSLIDDFFPRDGRRSETDCGSDSE